MIPMRISIVLSVLALCGCQSTSDITPGTGAVGGGVAGAAAGGIIGHQRHRGLEGAAIGGAIGALSGTIIGLDRQEQARNPGHIPLTRIAEMGREEVPDSVIIDEMRRTKSRYTLSSETITYLKNNKVGDRVIDYMLQTTPR